MDYIVIYTAPNSIIATMLVEKLRQAGIPAMLGKDSTAAGVFGKPYNSRTIVVPKKFFNEAKIIIRPLSDATSIK